MLDIKAMRTGQTRPERTLEEDTERVGYDLQGYYKAAIDNVDPKRFKLAVDPEGNLHFDDRFKKPNHYTFSTDSMYSGRDGYYGGQWRELGNNKYSYTVNPSNLYSNAELQDYFNRNEIGNILIDQRGK